MASPIARPAAELGLPAAKPDERVYVELCNQLQPSRARSCSSTIAPTTSAAAAFGLHVIWFVSPDELSRQVATLRRQRRAEDVTEVPMRRAG